MANTSLENISVMSDIFWHLYVGGPRVRKSTATMCMGALGMMGTEGALLCGLSLCNTQRGQA